MGAHEVAAAVDYIEYGSGWLVGGSRNVPTREKHAKPEIDDEEDLIADVKAPRATAIQARLNQTDPLSKISVSRVHTRRATAKYSSG